MPTELTDEALVDTLARERRKHGIVEVGPVRIGTLIPEAIAGIVRRCNGPVGAKTCISGLDRRQIRP